MAKKTLNDLYRELQEEKEKVQELEKEIKEKKRRKERYWRNREEEILRNKIWRLTQKLNKIIEERSER